MSTHDDTSSRPGARRGGGWRPPPSATDPRPLPPATDARTADGTAGHRDSYRSGGGSPPAMGAAAQTRAEHPSRSGIVAGEVRGLHVTTASSGNRVPETVVTFRVEGRDAGGTRTGITPVRLRGDDALGFAHDGDWVEVSGRRRNGVLLVTRGHNATTGAAYKGSAPIGRPMAIALTVVLLAVVAVIATLVVRAVQQADADFQEQVERNQQQFEEEQSRQQEEFREDALRACLNAGFSQEQCEATVG